ncbi:hypothetical protein G6F55_005869 [Rhizopus delemar]|nr:hypothetical protein G6F55_005869 [Rhizopus delemar]KAG1496165.1 hypothetical protein G6F54_006666 [Rhizopus delemar]KAG1597422.1 hypothetical protein G6F47_007331 [Rhizopus delemar]KAG1632071.1 hypothetical protein G6F45_004376 [Rhizopus arrhizus]
MLPSPSYPTVYFSLHLIVLIFKPRNAGLSNKTNRSPSHAFDPVQVNPMAPHFDTVDVSGWHGITAVMKLTTILVEQGQAIDWIVVDTVLCTVEDPSPPPERNRI